MRNARLAVVAPSLDLERRVEVLEAIVAELQRRRARVDPAADVRVCSAIAAAYGGAVFSAADLLASGDAEIAGLLRGLDTRAVGLWLRRLHRRPTPPYVLRGIGRDGHGRLWALAVDDERHTRASVSPRRGADSPP